ncbi:MAG: hypothetical protein ACRDLL_05475 [Solirubrobacterales bacterium]
MMTACARSGFAIADVDVDRPEGHGDGTPLVGVRMEIHGKAHVAELAARIGGLRGVREVHAGDVNEMFD